MTEIELAKIFSEHLFENYDLYYEVGLIDIVGKAKNHTIGVEVKTSLNLKVIEQAYRNRVYVNYSYIAVPSSKNTFALQICEDYGIGVLFYNEHSHSQLIYERVKPKLNRHVYKSFAAKLNEDSIYKKFIPGAKSGETPTAFSMMVEDVIRYVSRHNNCTLKDLIDGVESYRHHYSTISSAKQCLKGYIDSGVIKGVKRDGDKLYFERL